MRMPPDSLLKAIGAAIGDQVAKAAASLRERIEGIETRVKQIEVEGTAKALVAPASNGRIDEIERRLNDLPAWFGKDLAILKKGAKGEKGDQGEKGDRGDPGPSGAVGPVGPAGKDGVGIDGQPGPPGLVGEKGAPGKDGINGKDGADGLSIKGDPGADGVNGKDGSNGINGKDAPAVDTEALSAVIVEKVLGAIPKPKDGLDGKDGASVDLDTVRAILISEVNKAVEAIPKPAAGRDGRDGRKGEAGLAGKDALEMEVLPGIDEASSYPKGTWALHRGGTIMAYRTTDPVADGDLESAGWAVAQNGLHEMHAALGSDGRTLNLTAIGTNGKGMPMQVKLYVPQYQKTWESEKTYERGDYATMAGSLWHSNRTNKERPGTSDAWTLAVKRGSDGKDLNGTRQ